MKKRVFCIVLAGLLAMVSIMAFIAVPAFAADYTIYFNANGGTCSISSKKASGTFGELPTPSYFGSVEEGDRTFNGWYTEPGGGTRVTEDTAVTKSMTLYAHWGNYDGHYTKGRTYSIGNIDKPITWDLIGFTCIDDAYGGGYLMLAKSSTNGAVIPNKAFDDSSSRYSGSLMDNELSGAFYSAFPASFQTKLASVPIDVTEGIIPRQVFALSYAEVSTYGLTQTNASGWWTRTAQNAASAFAVYLDGGIKSRAVDATNIGYRPAFVIKDNTSYCIQFEPGSNGTTPVRTKTIKQGSAIGSLPTPINSSVDVVHRTKKIYTGWFTMPSGGEQISETTVPTGDKVLYAHWTDVNYDHLVEMVVDGESSFYAAVYGDKIKDLPIPEKRDNVDNDTRYTFAGWFTAPTNGIRIDDNDMILSDMTVYGRWQLYRLGYTVTFDTNGGSPASIDSQNLYAGEKVTRPPDPIKSGANFIYWSCNGREWNFNTDTVQSNITLIAEYAGPFTVRFDSNGGSEVVDQVVSYGGYAINPSVSRSKYTLRGWYTDAGDKWNFTSDRVYSDMSLLASWKKDSSTSTSSTSSSSTSSSSSSYYSSSSRSMSSSSAGQTPKIEPGSSGSSTSRSGISGNGRSGNGGSGGGNGYDDFEKPKSPITGDHWLNPYLALGIIAAIGAIVTLIIFIKKRRSW